MPEKPSLVASKARLEVVEVLGVLVVVPLLAEQAGERAGDVLCLDQQRSVAKFCVGRVGMRGD